MRTRTGWTDKSKKCDDGGGTTTKQEDSVPERKTLVSGLWVLTGT
jgi:hypothetical protein